MSRHELVQGYLDGQLSRRVFIRRLVGTGVTAAAALSYAGLLDRNPAAAAGPTDFYLVVDDDGFHTPALLLQGQGVQFVNHGELVHNARDTSGTALFNTGDMTPPQSVSVPPLPGAGVYPYRCDHHPELKGKLKVPVLATPSRRGAGRDLPHPLGRVQRDAPVGPGLRRAASPSRVEHVERVANRGHGQGGERDADPAGQLRVPGTGAAGVERSDQPLVRAGHDPRVLTSA